MVRLFNYTYTKKLYRLLFDSVLWNLSVKISGAKHEHVVKFEYNFAKSITALIKSKLWRFPGERQLIY